MSFELKGIDNSKDDKYNNINGVNFQVGDFIQLEHLEPFRIAIYDYDGNNVNLKYSKKMLFKITESGLKQTDENGNELSEVSSNVSSEDTVTNN